MDDLIVIILTLVFAVAGIFGQMKKKQAEKQTGGQPEPQPEAQPEDADNFWDFLEPESRENYMEQAPVAEPQKKKKFVQTVAEEPAVKKTEAKVQPKNAGTPVYSNDLTSDGKTDRKNKSTGKRHFPLKKAVIYSEILNRKYT